MSILPIAGQGPAVPGPVMSTGPVSLTIPIKQPAKPVAIKPPAAKKPVASVPKSDLAKWLAGDTTYQGQLSDYSRELQAYAGNNTRQNQMTNRDFATTQRQMNTQAGTDRENQQYDFAGRGILHSGVFAKALADYNTDYNTKLNNLVQGKTDTLNQSAADLSDFLRQITLQRNSAKQDAIRRRQQELGI